MLKITPVWVFFLRFLFIQVLVKQVKKTYSSTQSLGRNCKNKINLLLVL